MIGKLDHRVDSWDLFQSVLIGCVDRCRCIKGFWLIVRVDRFFGRMC